MKEPVRAFNKGLCLNRNSIHKDSIIYGSFKTIHNPLKQLPEKIKSYLKLLLVGRS